MKHSVFLLLLLGGVFGIDEMSETEPEVVKGRVTEKVLELIEVAVKLAQYSEIEEKQKALGWVQGRLDTIKGMLDAISAPSPESPPTEETEEPEVVYYADCVALQNEGFTDSGLYNIYPGYPEITEPVAVYCDQDTDGGGWTVSMACEGWIVFQRRTDGSQSFENTWEEYRQGFGDMSNEFWLGNDNLVLLTKPKESMDTFGGNVVLRVDITDWDDNTAFAKYQNFIVQGPGYTLTADEYSVESTAGNALDYHNGKDFTTIDNDNDLASGGNCAEWMRGGWWFSYCLRADPNGPYLFPGGQYGAFSPGTDQGVTWTTYSDHGYDGREYSLKGTEMKLRRAPEIAT